jgi:hypothetical protein
MSFPLKHDACYVVADSHICHEPSTGWQVIQPQPCEGQNNYHVCRLLNFILKKLAARFFPALSGRLRRVPCVMRPAVQHSLPQAVGFRCTHFTSEFDTRHAMDCHISKQSSLGTGCADPSNSKSVSFTGRASNSSSIIREHEFLGAHTNHTETVCVHRQLFPPTFNTAIVWWI